MPPKIADLSRAFASLSDALVAAGNGQLPQKFVHELSDSARTLDLQSDALPEYLDRLRTVCATDTPREMGATYTSRALARRAVRLAKSRIPNPSNVLDPSCGAGIFLEVAAENFPKAARAGTIHGWDIDPLACRLSEVVLLLAGSGGTIAERDALITTGDTGGYDLIVGNPPWVSYSGRHAAPITADRRDYLVKNYESVAGWPTLHAPFVERSIALLRPGGVLALLLPRQIAENAKHGVLRRILRQRCEDIQALDLGEDAFDGITSPAMLLLAKRCSEPAREAASEAAMQCVSPVAITSTPEWEERLNAHLERLPRVPKESFADIGVHSGNCAGKLVLKSAIGTNVPLYEGRDVQPFHLGNPRRWLRLDYQAGAGEYFRLGSDLRRRQVRFLIRQTAAHVIAAPFQADCGAWFRNSCLACFGIAGIGDQALLSLLNSELFAWIAETRFAGASQRAFPQIKISHLRSLPMPGPERSALLELSTSTGNTTEQREKLCLEAFGLPRELWRLLHERQKVTELASRS